MKIPIAGWDDDLIKLRFLSVFFQSGIGSDINALLLSGMDFTPPIEASAAGPVALVFRALRHRAEIGNINESAISAVFAVENQDLD